MMPEQFYIPPKWSPVQKKAFKAFHKKHPETTSSQFKASHPDFFTPEPSTTLDPEPSPKEIPASHKSPRLKKFENQTLVQAGDPLWHLYGRGRGAWYFMGEVDDPSPAAIGEEFGGGKYMVRMVDPETDFEMVGNGKSLIFNLHPGIYGEAKAKMPLPSLPISPQDDPKFEDEAREYSPAEVEEVKKEAEEKAGMKMQLAALMAQPPKSEIDSVAKMIELQKLLMPPPVIGEQKDFAQKMLEWVTAISALIPAVKGALAAIVPPSTPENPATALLMEGVRALPGVLAAAKGNSMPEPGPSSGPAAAVAEAGKIVEQATQASNEGQDMMMTTLSSEIMARQKAEMERPEVDQVLPMAKFVLSQNGLEWSMLRAAVEKNSVDEIVKYLSGKNPAVADTDFKRNWLANVVEVLKNSASPEIQAALNGKK